MYLDNKNTKNIINIHLITSLRHGPKSKTNFFESRPTQYQNASVLNKNKTNTFNFTEDF